MELHITTQIGLILRIFSLILILCKVLPKQYREYKTHTNGLRRFRLMLLLLGILIAFTLFVATFFVLQGSMGNPLGILMYHITLVYSFTESALALLLYFIYNGRDGEK